MLEFYEEDFDFFSVKFFVFKKFFFFCGNVEILLGIKIKLVVVKNEVKVVSIFEKLIVLFEGIEGLVGDF